MMHLDSLWGFHSNTWDSSSFWTSVFLRFVSIDRLTDGCISVPVAVFMNMHGATVTSL